MDKEFDFEGKELQITAKRDGFRRGGIAHSSKPTTYKADDLTSEQIAQFLAEPELVVVVLDKKDKEPELTEAEQIAKVAVAVKALETEGKNINVTNLSEKVGFKVTGAVKDKAVEQNKQG